MLRLNPSGLDYALIAVYFLVVLGIGAVARLSVKTDIDFFLSGRRLPAWITGLAFIAANLGALEILGQAANGAEYGIATVHIRRIIGGLFTLYGIVLVVVGLVGAHHVKVKAAGININLWAGLGMLVVAAILIGWALARPVRLDPPRTA